MSFLPRLRRSLTALVIVGASLVACELLFRALIFSKIAAGERFRNPALYFDYFGDDRFWEANWFFGEPSGKTGTATHPLVGWISPKFLPNFDYGPHSPLAGRRPVLLYGDSFAGCSASLPRCFEDFFNADQRFSGKCYLFNYAVGAHGVDQTYLTFKNSVDRYHDPFVVYTLMTMDLDRAILHVFLKQKPYFTLDGDRLVLAGLPIDPDVGHFFAGRRPRVPSYLYRLLCRKWTRHNAFATDASVRSSVQAIGRRILQQAIADLRSKKLDFLFVVFVPNMVGESYLRQPDAEDWRLTTILSVLREENVPYVVTKDILKPVLASRPNAAAELFLTDGHPTDEQNEMIFEAIRERITPCQP